MVFHFLLGQNSERKSNRMHKLSSCLFKKKKMCLERTTHDLVFILHYLCCHFISVYFYMCLYCADLCNCCFLVNVTWSPVMEEAHYFVTTECFTIYVAMQNTSATEVNNDLIHWTVIRWTANIWGLRLKTW